MGTVLAALVVAVLAQEEAGAARVEPPAYPCAANKEVIRFFHLEEDEPDLAKMGEALRELGAELVHGPRTAGGSPGKCFLALRAPAAASDKKLAAAVRKGGGKAKVLECLVFEGGTGGSSDLGLSGLGVTERDLVIGMSGDVLWVDRVGARTQLYGPPGKLDAEDLAEVYEKLYAPYGGAKLGTVAVETITWTLAVEPEERKVKAVLKAIEKLDSVDTVRLDGRTLTVVVRLAGLESCTPAGDLGGFPGRPLDQETRGAPRAAFDTDPLYALLVEEGLVAGADGDD